MGYHAYIALDDGHGMNTPGKRTPYIPELKRQILENEFNRAVVYYLKKELEHNGFKVLLTAPETNDVPLSTRVKRANNAKVDLFVSVHYNAYDSKFNGNDPEGVEAFIYDWGGTREKVARAVLAELVKGTKQKNRGIKVAKFYVLKYTTMPAVLLECGFMDNKREALLMIDPDFQKETAADIARGICKHYGVTYKAGANAPKPAPKEDDKDDILYCIQVGAFANRDNAEEQLKKLEKAGFKGFIFTKRA